MGTSWHVDLARHLEVAAGMLREGREQHARRELATGMGYVLHAATQGDDEAFQWLNQLRASVDDASPTNLLDLDKIEE
ncbi:MAG TPA: hypothetical protein PKA88_00035 [Polyangiaceae bacterium]|nr:hypothetical protein [Polyangiaceae bacterium]